MSEHTEKLERNLLYCAYTDGESIDRALAAGVTPEHFRVPSHRNQWSLLCELRVAGKSTASEDVYAAALAGGRLDSLGGLQGLLDASTVGGSTIELNQHIAAIVELHAKRRAWHLLQGTTEAIKAGTATTESIRMAGERVVEICTGISGKGRTVAEAADEALRDAKEAIAGTAPTRTLLYTGIPSFDKYATPMESHEYVVVGARTSHGKSSFMNQVANHNLNLGRRVAIFTLETSDKAVVKQLAAQQAGISLKNLTQETTAKQDAYIDRLHALKASKDLLVFDQDTRLSAIEARCRLLATSFKPDLVIVDYLQLIGIDGDGQYDRITRVSKAMIPLRKALGCVLMLGSQLSRTSEKEGTQPARTDFRDSGAIEEDAHRIIALWRKPGQALDLDYYESSILQLKLRDGPLCEINCTYHAPTTLFKERAA